MLPARSPHRLGAAVGDHLSAGRSRWRDDPSRAPDAARPRADRTHAPGPARRAAAGARTGSGSTAACAVSSFAATLLDAHRHRHVALEGARNVRDLGGLPASGGRRTRPGVVFRGDTLAHLSAADLARLATLELRTVVDLRTASERERAPDRLPAPTIDLRTPGFLPRGNPEMIAAVNAGALTAADAVAAMQAQYRLLALEHLDVYREVLDRLCEDDGTPLLFHCASGKDRTGVTAAIVLLAVGVAPDLVREDYLISNFQRRPVDLFTDGAQAAAVEQIMAADPRYLDAALAAAAESYGSFDAYLARGLGYDDRRRSALAARLLD